MRAGRESFESLESLKAKDRGVVRGERREMSRKYEVSISRATFAKMCSIVLFEKHHEK